MNKLISRTGLLVISILILLLFPFLTAGVVKAGDDGHNWVISGNKVYIDDSNVYLSATPHTLGSSGWVEFEVLSKHYSGEVDVGFGFTGDGGSVTKLQYWRYGERIVKVQANVLKSYTIHNVTEYDLNYEPKEGDRYPVYGNEPYTGIAFLKCGEFPNGVVVYYDSYSGTLVKMTISFYRWEMQNRSVCGYDWFNINRPINTAYISVEETDRWETVYFDAPITAGVTYRVRAWVEILWAGRERVQGEYFFGIKPHGETIEETKEKGHLYYLDPWWDVNWSYRNILSFNASNISENLIDFPVLVKLTSSNFNFSLAQTSGEDIRFVDKDDTTSLSYEIESWNGTAEEAWIWVKVPQMDASSNYTDYIYMYYGNPGASDNQSPSNVWNANYKMVQHMKNYIGESSGITLDSTSNSNNGIKKAPGEPIETTGYIAKGQDFDGLNDYISLPNTANSSDWTAGTVEAWLKLKTVPPAAWRLAYNDTRLDSTLRIGLGFLTGAKPTLRITTSGELEIDTQSPSTIDTTSFHHIVGSFDAATDLTLIYVDSTLMSTNNTAFDALASGNWNYTHIGGKNSQNTANATIDEVRVSNIARSANWVKASWMSGNNSLLYYGDTDPPPSLDTLPASNITINKEGVTAATLSGNLTSLGGAPSADCWFDFGSAITYGDYTTNATYNSTGVKTAKISSNITAPGQTWHFRFAGTNVDGTTLGSDATFSATMPTVTTVGASQVAHTNTITLSGEITSLGSANDTYAKFQWGYSSGSYAFQTDNQTFATTANFTAEITNVPADSTVYYRAILANGETISAGSEKSITLPTQLSLFQGVERFLYLSPLLIAVLVFFSGPALLFIGAKSKNILLMVVGSAINIFWAIVFFIYLPIVLDVITSLVSKPR